MNDSRKTRLPRYLLLAFLALLGLWLLTGGSEEIPISVVASNETRYLILIPGFGPNNQYRETKEAMVVALHTGRTFVRPTYVAHKVKGPTGHRKFETTYDPEIVNTEMLKYAKQANLPLPAPSISIEEYSEKCDGKIDMLVWAIDAGGWWLGELKDYLTNAQLQVTKHLHVQKDKAEAGSGAFKDKIYFQQINTLTKYFAQTSNVKCLGFAFPFRTVSGKLNEQVVGLSSTLVHAPDIKKKSLAALEEMGVSYDELIVFHWRDGESSCRVEAAELHQGFDFCWGTTAYYWARIKDVITVLQDLMKATSECGKGIKHIYLATDHQGTEVIQEFKKHLPLSIAKDIETISSIKDNYFVSLIEQEMGTQAKTFIGSSGSTWTENIRDHRVVVKNGISKCFQLTLNDLLKQHSFEYITHSYWDHVLNYKGKKT